MNKNSFRKWLIICLGIMLFAVIQTGADRILRVKFIAPDLLFAFAVSFACFEKKWHNILICALISGMVSDFVCHSEIIGYTAVYPYTALLVYFLKNQLLRPNAFFVIVIALLTFIVGKTVLFPVFYIARGVDFTNFFLNDVLPSGVYNTVCFFVMYLIFGTVRKRVQRRL